MVRCGYAWSTHLRITWIINGTTFDQSAIQSSPLYQLNNPLDPRRITLTVFSINGTTTFQCIVHSTPSTTSTLGTVTVTTGMYVHMYIRMHIHK